ncbi:AfsR/SARP family transcriptional regulator [Streptomyces mayteni]
MDIRLLGSVRLRTGGRGIAPASERARQLLALLAWDPGEFLPDGAVIDQLWGSEPPQHPRDALYTCANRLRRTLAPALPAGAEHPLIRRRGGYELAVDPSAVDVHRFRRLVSRARTAAWRNDDTGAVSLYDRALALRTGTPLSDLGSAWATRARATLEDEWCAALQARVGIRLRLGHHTEEVPGLRELVERHPLDESLAELLMLALYRSGRQSDALTCFNRIRRALVERLGNEPGDRLRTLHQRILRQDPGLVPLVGAGVSR